MALTARTALVALVAVAVTFVSPRLMWPLDGLLALAVLADLALAAPVRSLRLTRSGPACVRLGESVARTVSVANAGRRRARGVLRDGWVPSAGASPRTSAFVVPAGESRRLDVTLSPTRRGERRTERITVRCLGPLGLAGRQRRVALPGAVTVLAPFPSRRLLPEKLSRLRQIDGLVALRGAGQGTEVDTLREYADGDDARAVDWMATARRGSVIVRTYRPERDRRLLLVLDTGRTSAGRVGDTPRLDHSLDAALLLAALATRAGDRVGLLAHDASLRADTSSGSRADVLARLVSAMTPLQPALMDADWPAITGQILRRATRRSLVVLFTDLAPVVVEESLRPILGSLLRRHTVLVASVADPQLTAFADPATTAADGVRGAYRSAAASRALLERTALAGGLRRAGAEVVDAPPEGFASAVADSYLALKAAGRL